ncbi:MAG: hypothetical protein QME89_03640 [Actinomycetota bacterium]|nr:hypothetical protein [Actinomycetota bacterium]
MRTGPASSGMVRGRSAFGRRLPLLPLTALALLALSCLLLAGCRENGA